MPPNNNYNKEEIEKIIRILVSQLEDVKTNEQRLSLLKKIEKLITEREKIKESESEMIKENKLGIAIKMTKDEIEESRKKLGIDIDNKKQIERLIMKILEI